MNEKSIFSKIFEICCGSVTILATLIFLGCAIKVICNKEPDFPQITVSRIKPIELSAKPMQHETDSILRLLISNNQGIQDSLLVLNRKLLEQKKESYNSDDKVKTYASIIGLILAITGLFGLKSINDIRENSLTSAKTDSQKIAESTARITATEVAKAEAILIATETAKTVAKETADIKAAEVAENIATTVADSSAEKFVKASIGDYKSELNDLKDAIRENNKRMNLKFNNLKEETRIIAAGGELADDEEIENNDTPLPLPINGNGGNDFIENA